MTSENDKIREFQTLQSHVESPMKALRAVEREIDYRSGSCGQTIDGTTYRPTYGSSADSAYAALERKERLMRMGDWP